MPNLYTETGKSCAYLGKKAFNKLALRSLYIVSRIPQCFPGYISDEVSIDMKELNDFQVEAVSGANAEGFCFVMGLLMGAVVPTIFLCQSICQRPYKVEYYD